MKRTWIPLAALAATLFGASSALAFPGGLGGPGQGGQGGPNGRHRPPTFDELDADGNGLVTNDEFVAPMLEHLDERFSAIDADGDGNLTSDEFDAARPSRGQ